MLIEDELQGWGSHRAEARFLVPFSAVEIRPLREDERRQVRAALPARAWDFERAVAIGDLALLIVGGAIDAPHIEEGVYARGYGELVAHALHVCFPFGGALPIVFCAALLPVAGAAGRREEASAYGAA